MYAVVEIAGQQFKVQKGDILKVNRIEAKEGKEIYLNNVLLFSDKDKVEIGTPYLKKVKVISEVVGHLKGQKVISYKYRRRKSSHWKKGFRASLTRLKIKEITVG